MQRFQSVDVERRLSIQNDSSPDTRWFATESISRRVPPVFDSDPRLRNEPSDRAAVVQRAMVRVTALVPLKDNNGRAFPPEYFLALQQFLTRSANGFQDHGVVFGRWADAEGKVFTDTCTSFVITCDRKVAERLLAGLDVLIRTLFEQEAAYVELSNVRVSNF